MSKKSRNTPPRAVGGQEGPSGRPQVPEDPSTLFPGPTGLKSTEAVVVGSVEFAPVLDNKRQREVTLFRQIKEELTDAWMGIDEEYNAGQPHTPSRTFKHGETGYHLQQLALLIGRLETEVLGGD